ncbi:N-ethylmaleimide reductase [Oceanospirillum multiglobuliferum]|uniref:Alkene reductase n=1 Tax=Oceanospirillum multiglobuliferum TaxID=64969 RepID=A0A1T4KBZ3_9GAMM|nr:alkene reductase [Oceanospirillum multiglobuliferum]OPX55981.1 alkene reductase [Oceanospirillum multiglobuliferum]SJZ39939.1 N-ethylmaleimide reductase [Oceanospirillum multiglobuliferum]
MTDLFTPLTLGAVEIKNRILMAPLTRCRADENHVPTDLITEHYAQRASGGLLIAEATMAMEGNSAFWREPGIYSEAQVEGWKKVTDAVHAKDGKIFLQIWHGGRACHPALNEGKQPVAPSAIAITNSDIHTPEGKQSYTVPRALDDAEIPAIIEGFAKAAENAKRAGFDGVEIHGANGYLLDEFLRDGANHREGPYGGSLENRARLLLEVIEAVSKVWGSDRVGVRLSPLNTFNSMSDSDPVGLMTWLSEKLSGYDLAYLHLMRANFMGAEPLDVITPTREHYKGNLIVNMGYSPQEAQQVVADGIADAVAFGVPFLANPDLPHRIKEGAELNQADPKTFYTQGYAGYNDYPTLDALALA